MDSREKGISRLKKLQSENHSTRDEMRLKAHRFNALRETSSPVAISSFNLFQTPENVAFQLVDSIEIFGSVCEPSAGLGRIYRAIRSRHDNEITLIENSPECCGQLYREIEHDENAKLIQNDFLETENQFDHFLMNPPFKMGRDVKHILHAISLLKNGGSLAALCYNGSKQNKQLKPIADTWQVLPENSFKESGTRASVALMTYSKQ